MSDKQPATKKYLRREITMPTIEAAGAVLLAIGVFMIWVPAGFIVSGALLIVAMEASA